MNSSKLRNNRSANADMMFIDADSPEVSFRAKNMIRRTSNYQPLSPVLFFMRNRNLVQGQFGPKQEKMTLTSSQQRVEIMEIKT